MAVRAEMIENIDQTIGRVINFLKQISQDDQAIGTMFNSNALYAGDWAVWNGSRPVVKWQLYNYVRDPAENNDVADQNPGLVQKMIAAHQNYSKDAGIEIPRGELFAFQVSRLTSALNQTQTIQTFGVLP